MYPLVNFRENVVPAYTAAGNIAGRQLIYITGCIFRLWYLFPKVNPGDEEFRGAGNIYGSTLKLAGTGVDTR